LNCTTMSKKNKSANKDAADTTANGSQADVTQAQGGNTQGGGATAIDYDLSNADVKRLRIIERKYGHFLNTFNTLEGVMADFREAANVKRAYMKVVEALAEARCAGGIVEEYIPEYDALLHKYPNHTKLDPDRMAQIANRKQTLEAWDDEARQRHADAVRETSVRRQEYADVTDYLNDLNEDDQEVARMALKVGEANTARVVDALDRARADLDRQKKEIEELKAQQQAANLGPFLVPPPGHQATTGRPRSSTPADERVMEARAHIDNVREAHQRDINSTGSDRPLLGFDAALNPVHVPRYVHQQRDDQHVTYRGEPFQETRPRPEAVGRERARRERDLVLRDHPPDRWWLEEFEGDWQVQPYTTEDPQAKTRAINTKGLTKFAGDPDTYPDFKNEVIHHIHRSPTTWANKLMALKEVLDRTKPAVSACYPSNLKWSPFLYAELIRNLEDKFGGDDRTLKTHLRKIQELPLITKEDYALLERLFAATKSYQTCVWALDKNMGRQEADVIAEVFTRLFPPWRSEYLRERHCAARHNQGRPEAVSLQGLLGYMRSKLQDWRSADVFLLDSAKKKAVDKSKTLTTRAADPEDNDPPTYVMVGRTPRPAPEQETATKLDMCPICESPHDIETCKIFAKGDNRTKKAYIVQYKLCYTCLISGHLSKDCPKGVKCSVLVGADPCGAAHHPLLHQDPRPRRKATVLAAGVGDRPEDQWTDSDEDEDDEVARVNVARSAKRVSLRCVPVVVRNPVGGESITVNALLDEGAERTFISEEIAAFLNLRGRVAPLTIEGPAGQRSEHERTLVAKVRIGSDWDPKLDREAVVNCIPSPVEGLWPVDWTKEADRWPHLKGIPFPKPARGEVQMIIGAPEADLMAATQQDTGETPEGPVARLCPLGWTALGRVRPAKKGTTPRREELQELQTHVLRCAVQNAKEMSRKLMEEDPYAASAFRVREQRVVLDRDLNELVAKQWQLERLPGDEAKAMSQEDKYALTLLDEKMTRLPNGKYQAPVLWRKGEPAMPNNYSYALDRFRGFQKSKMMTRPDTRAEINASIREWLDQGYIREVPEAEARPRTAYYLPIFVVTKKEGDIVKYRVVTDCKAKFNNKSLNDAVLPGPCAIPDMTLTLTRFRHKNVAVVADVARMFLQVALPPEDRRYHRFLHAFNPDEPPKEYEFLVHVFGNAGSPTVSTTVVRNYAQICKDRYPNAAEIILKNTHVDDTLASYDSEAEAVSTSREVKTIFSEIGMNWRKLSSNSKAVLRAFLESEWAKEHKQLLMGESFELCMPTKKVLGIDWDTQEDMLVSSSVGEVLLSKPVSNTKRGILGLVSSMFDPLGLRAPVLVQGRLLVQECWRRKLDWDDPLPDDLAHQWGDWVTSLKDLGNLRTPRVLVPTCSTSPVDTVQLHTFCDASGRAYAAVVYVRVLYEDGRIYVNLVESKARLAPLLKQTIPRLELEAAKVGAVLHQPLKEVLKADECYLWSDSTNVLCWLKTQDLEPRMYVANRVATILTATQPEQWGYVHTKSNPADLASRGATVSELAASELWALGPGFLRTPQDTWPSHAPDLQLDEEAKDEMKPERTESVLVLTTMWAPSSRALDGSWLPSHTVSTWPKLLRVTATVLLAAKRFLSLRSARQPVCQAPKRPLRDIITAPESLEAARMELLRDIQRSFAGRECSSERDVDEFVRTHGLRPLRPFRDPDHGLWRVGSRAADSANLKFDMKHPIILPRQHPGVNALLRHIHGTVLSHVGGHAHLLAEAQKQYWVVAGKTEARRVTSGCVVCKRTNAHPERQEQGNLPEYRIPTPGAAPFENVLIDGAGPFKTTVGRRSEKKWLAIFSCAMTRAIHVEVLDDVSTDNFLMAFDRFVARRGMPAVVRTDNGTNFVGAAAFLKDLWASWDHALAVERGYASIKWIFSAPLAPHTNGAVERAVGLLKKGLVAVMPDSGISPQALHTVALKVEGILNSRPITYISTSSEDGRALTPMDFLLPLSKRELGPIPEDDGARLRKLWNRVNTILDDLWSYFVKHALPALHAVTVKGGEQPHRNLKPGDVVALLEEKDRGRWPLARVVSAHEDQPGGRVRFVDIRVARRDGKVVSTKVFRRHINRIMLLVPQEPQEAPGPDPETPTS
jgi:transposase InsO family protein